MKRYWLVLFPDTFLWIKGNRGIIYNSKNFKHFTFECCETMITICNKLSDLDSLYSVEISGSLINEPLLKSWVDQLVDIEGGCLIENNGQNKKIVSYYPFLKIHNGFEQIEWEHKLNIGGKIINNIRELIFYVNGSINGSNKFYKQTYYPLKTNESLNFNLVKSFIDQCSNEMMSQITFIGDLFHYDGFKQLYDWTLISNLAVQFVMISEDIDNDMTNFGWAKLNNFDLTVIVNDYPRFSQKYKNLEHSVKNIRYVFPVKSINEMNSIAGILQETNIENYNIVPIYNGRNKKFFEDNVYTTNEEMVAVELTKREVFINMTLNIHSFGKLIVLPDGKIYSNVNNSSIGIMGDPIYDLVYKEMTKGEPWFKLRDMKPCCDCVYQWLCPSPGSYEQVIGKPNLCHIS